jgi:hypothetical protein
LNQTAADSGIPPTSHAFRDLVLVALVLGIPCGEELALPKSIDSSNLSLNKLVIRWGRSS